MRKQVYDLTAADPEAHPVWEHCLVYRLLGADAAGVFPVRHCLVDKRKGWFSRERVVETIS